MKLYDASFSSNCRKVRICADELGLPLDLVPVDPVRGGMRAPDYLAKNPMGKIPTLEDDGFVLFESTAICDYLASKRPEVGLAPTDPRGRADLWRWLAWFTAHIQPWIATTVVERRIKPLMGGTTNEAAVQFALGELTRFVPVLEQHLADREHVLERFSIADICLGVSFESAPFGGFDLAPFPRIRAWLDRLRTRTSWKKHPATKP